MAKAKKSIPFQPVSDAELRKCVEAYRESGGNRSEAARMCGLPRNTYRERLMIAEKKFKLKLGKVVDGRMDVADAEVRPLPPEGAVARYILSSCQNNTHPHRAGLDALLAYRDWLQSDEVNGGNDTCEFILGSFSYAIDAYGEKSTKRGTFDEKKDSGSLGKLWYAPELEPFIKDRAIQLAPALMWCGEMNILPTAANPLTGMDDYNGRASNIVPHVKHALQSVASLADEATKLNYSTGTITLRNYIQKRVGILAEPKHCYGGLIVEVDAAGNWYVRQLTVDSKGCVYDIGPAGFRSVRAKASGVDALVATPVDGAKARPKSWVENITWGDIHASEMDLEVREAGWESGGLLDQLTPRSQCWHDLFSMRSRGHHEMKNFHRMFQKYVNGEGRVEDEMRVTADFCKDAWRTWCETVVVRSNHCRHLDRWLCDEDARKDLPNVTYWMALNGALLKAMEDGDRDFNVLEYALRQCGIPESIRFLGEDESYVVAKGGAAVREGIECGLHGDLGPNGARGSSRSLKKLGRPVNKDHDHTATIMDAVFSGGACSLDFPYMKGPNAHSVSHIVTFENAARQILTYWQGKFRA
jgi:hypothetical protein